jgi:hypothetical protein
VIAPLAGWSLDWQGQHIWLRPRDGRASCVIRYTERLRTAPWGQLLRDHLGETTLRNPVLRSLDELVTAEGEHAAVGTLDCTLNGKPVQETVGCVWVDEFVAFTVGIALDPDDFGRVAAAVRELVHGDAHMMRHRRRRYRHLAPAAWHATARWGALNVVYVHPDRHGELTVAAAMPQAASAEHEPVTLRPHLQPDTGPDVLSWVETTCPRLRAGLRGRCYRLDVQFADGGQGVRWVAELRDRTYVYPLHLDARAPHAADGRAEFERVVASVSALDPLPVAHGQDGAAAMFGWMLN